MFASRLLRYSFGLLRHMGTHGFQLCTSFWKSRPDWVALTDARSSTGDLSNCAMYCSICSRIRGSFSAARSSAFSTWVNPPHNGHFTTSSLIIAYLFWKGEFSRGRRRSAPRPASQPLDRRVAVRTVTRVAGDCDEGHRLRSNGKISQLTVRAWLALVPPLEQPRSALLPPGVFTATVKLPGAA